MKKIAMMGVAAVGLLVAPLAGVGSAFAAESAPAATNAANLAADDGYWCDQSGIGSEDATVTCYNQTDQARYAHFHVDCWAVGDNDTDQNKWAGPWGSVSFTHHCWSHVQSIEAYFQ